MQQFSVERNAHFDWHQTAAVMSTSGGMGKEMDMLVRQIARKLMSTSGGLSKECDKLVRQIAMKLSLKRGERYSDVVGFIRRRLRFDLLRTCVIALRGFKKNAALEKIEDLEFNLRPVAANY